MFIFSKCTGANTIEDSANIMLETGSEQCLHPTTVIADKKFVVTKKFQWCMEMELLSGKMEYELCLLVHDIAKGKIRTVGMILDLSETIDEKGSALLKLLVVSSKNIVMDVYAPVCSYNVNLMNLIEDQSKPSCATLGWRLDCGISTLSHSDIIDGFKNVRAAMNKKGLTISPERNKTTKHELLEKNKKATTSRGKRSATANDEDTIDVIPTKKIYIFARKRCLKIS